VISLQDMVCKLCVIGDGESKSFYDDLGRIYAKVEDLVSDPAALGSTEVCFDYIIPGNATNVPGGYQPQIGDIEGDWQPYINRVFTISPASPSPTKVYLYVRESEYNNFKSRIDLNPDFDTRWKYKVVSVDDLMVTKYEGGSNGSFTSPGSLNGDTVTIVKKTLITTGSSGNVWEFELRPITSFSTFYIHSKNTRYGTAPLPIELVTFTATALTSSIMLDWQTASELNNALFEVERSLDGISFSKIGELPGNGTTDVPHFYQLEDKAVTQGVRYYYRLRQIDFNGDYTYSSMVSAILDPMFNFILGEFKPNPTKGKSAISITTVQPEKLEYYMYNVTGIEVMRKTIEASEGYSTLEFDFSKLPAGSYMGKFNTPDGRIIRKLVKID